jgi:hypothetical protein
VLKQACLTGQVQDDVLKQACLTARQVQDDALGIERCVWAIFLLLFATKKSEQWKPDRFLAGTP